MSASSSPELERLQRWLQAVLMHPAGAAAGVASPAARENLDITPENLGEVVSRSRALTSVERLEIYCNAYYARLLECLREEFPALRHAVGDEAFDEFAVGYLQRYPSESYTLADLAGRFPQFLAETRPADAEVASDEPSWPDFLIDLARLERIYSDVFDGPGVERQRRLGPADLQAISPESWPAVRLRFAPCFRLETFRFPVHEFITAVRHKSEGQDIPLSASATTWLAVTRRDYVVRRYPLSSVQYELLLALAEGKSLGEALLIALEATQGDPEELAPRLRTWFEEWTAAPFFLALELPDAAGS
jgi:hypothetical protein